MAITATDLTSACQMINETLVTLGYEYQIDTTSETTMNTGLNAIGHYPPSQLNVIMEQLNLVVQQRNYGVMFDAAKNKFRNFLVDMTPEGFGIEDVFHELLDGSNTFWDENALGDSNTEAIMKDLVGYKTPQIHKFFHTEGDSRKFDTTVDTRNYEKVFTARGVTRYIDTKLANLSWSAEVWLMNRVIGIIQTMITNGHIKSFGGYNINTKSGLDNVVEEVKYLTAGFLTPSNEFNIGAPSYDESTHQITFTPVINMTDSEDDTFIVTTPEIIARLKVQGYANAFNLSQYELEGRIIYAPAGTDFGEIGGEKVYMVILDRRSVLIGLRRWLATAFYVSNTGWTNNFLNIEILKGYNTVFNCVAITGEAIDTFFNQDGATVFIKNPDNLSISFSTDGILEINDTVGYTKYFSNCHKLIMSNPEGYFTIMVNGTSSGIGSVADIELTNLQTGSVYEITAIV